MSAFDAQAKNALRDDIKALTLRVERGERQRKLFWLIMAASLIMVLAVTFVFVYYFFVMRPQLTQERNEQAHSFACGLASVMPPSDDTRAALIREYHCSAADLRPHDYTLDSRKPHDPRFPA